MISTEDGSGEWNNVKVSINFEIIGQNKIKSLTLNDSFEKINNSSHVLESEELLIIFQPLIVYDQFIHFFGNESLKIILIVFHG